MKRLGLRGGGRPDFAQGGGRGSRATWTALRDEGAATCCARMLEGPGAA